MGLETPKVERRLLVEVAVGVLVGAGLVALVVVGIDVGAAEELAAAGIMFTVSPRASRFVTTDRNSSARSSQGFSS